MTCSVERCELPSFIRGMCMTHYSRQVRYGNPYPDVPTWFSINPDGTVRGVKTSVGKKDDEECLTCVDVEWLLKFGVAPDDVATRLGYSRLQGLRHHLRTHQRHDLVEKIRKRSSRSEPSLEISA